MYLAFVLLQEKNWVELYGGNKSCEPLGTNKSEENEILKQMNHSVDHVSKGTVDGDSTPLYSEYKWCV